MTTQITTTVNSEPEKNSELSKFPFKSFFKASDFLVGGLLAANWIYPAYHLKRLAENIPMQYSLTGAINWSGSKYLIFLLPVAATFSVLSNYFWPKNDERTLYPLKVPANKPEKVNTLATYLKKMLGVITQASVLAGAVLLVKGPTASQGTRAKWINTGLVVGLVAILGTYLETHYLLHH